MRINMAWGVLNLTAGAALALLVAWHLWGEARVDPSNAPRAEVRVSPSVVVAERKPVVEAAAPAGLPAGTAVTDTLSGTVTAPGCADPVEVRCHVAVEPGGGRRLILEAPGGVVGAALHEHVYDSDVRALPKPWRVLALAGYNLGERAWEPGAMIERDFGPVPVGVGVLPGYVFVSAGLRF